MGVCLLAACLALAHVRRAAAQEPQLTVSREQIVTLSGSGTSLRDVIQQLCAASDVELRQYDAEDRPFAGKYTDVPLSELLPRLLRAESYAAGLRSTAGKDGVRVAWVRVMGKADKKPEGPTGFRPVTIRPAMAAAAPAPEDANQTDGPKPMTEAELPADQAATIIAAVLNPAFVTTDNEDERKQQIDTIAKNFAENPATKTTLERADLAAIGQKLAQYPDARSVFAMIQTTIHDPDMQRRFNTIGSSLNAALASSVGR